ncbi:hypothetical protein D9M71_395740 [compost metagenome]
MPAPRRIAGYIGPPRFEDSGFEIDKEAMSPPDDFVLPQMNDSIHSVGQSDIGPVGE